ncbi:YqaJ viral recombinase family protein [Sinorhizobium meliloti]|uniref:Exonuclease n=1 Tax=Rhizobium meliloti TaxID=382 RepID=A0AAW9TNC1_RHIML|nr:lambda exonuclease family protein [Sinorhizobium meliloti]MDE3771554.1 YqaJ viral recombinase family protein [Sinorhizobium meliloti]MDE3790476.1 YqaJ viral recombinase family protein [Sinorhizobium meliloti]MDW9709826.1 exonuclease [Sinorhizobium meliloti]MDW9748125.1 exonuclease [Sinorhizobium meliloti]MDW9803436.1 exonuclease [Sinorhizobium meliloti]
MDNIVQGTAEWHSLRLGKVTASRVADVIAKTKTGYSASRANYAAQLVTERLTGLPTEGFTNAAMQWGTDMEPEARAAYEFYRAEEVEQIAFVPHPTIGDAGASPDGQVGPDGLVEIKCPNTATHIETLIGRAVPSKHVTQMQWQMACTGRKWCDFVSFDPRMPESMRFFCQRVHRDDAMIAELEREVIIFLNEVRAKVAELRRLYEQADADAAAELLMAG